MFVASACAMFSFGFGSDDSGPTAAAASVNDALELDPSEIDGNPGDWESEQVAIHGAPTFLKRALPEAALPALLRKEAGDSISATDLASGKRKRTDQAASDRGHELADSDLVPGVYEGGFKLWECARDLVVVLEEMESKGDLTLREARVLEAGCGAGLPGVLALTKECSSLVLQDFNAQVLRCLTMPTVALNGLWEGALSRRVRFLSGDWAAVSMNLSEERAAAACAARVGIGAGSGAPDEPGGGFDVILSADTIYSLEGMRRLWQLVQEQLAWPGGVALVAAKSYYFGVGGSVAEFRRLVGSDERFECASARVFDDGRSNKREVLILRWRHKDGLNSQPAEI